MVGGLRQDSKYFEVAGMASAPQQGHLVRGPVGELSAAKVQVHGNPPGHAEVTPQQQQQPPQLQRPREKTPTPGGAGGGADMSAALRRARTPLAKGLRDDDKKSFEMKKEGAPHAPHAPHAQHAQQGAATASPPPHHQAQGATLAQQYPHLPMQQQQQQQQQGGGAEELNPSREWVRAKFEEEIDRIKREGQGAAGAAGGDGGGVGGRGGGLASVSYLV